MLVPVASILLALSWAAGVFALFFYIENRCGNALLSRKISIEKQSRLLMDTGSLVLSLVFLCSVQKQHGASWNYES